MAGNAYRPTAAYNGGQLPVVQAGLIGPLLRFAEERGADTGAMCARAHLPADMLEQPSHFVPAAGWFQLYQDVVRDSGLKDVGWRVACKSPMQAYSRELNEGISKAPTLLEALRFVSRAQHRHCNTQQFWIRVIGNYGYVFHNDTYRHPGYEQRNAFRAASTILFARACLGDDWRPDLVITQTPLDVLPAGEMLDGVRIVQRRHYSAIRIPRALLIAAPRHGFQGTYTGGAGAAVDVPGQIRQLLRSYGRDDMPPVQDLAQMMNLSTRSLQRSLSRLHTSYSQLVCEATFATARDLLEDTTQAITSVAYRLGYDDSSHFSRFFRRMGGVSPREYRRGLEDGIYEPPEQAAAH